MPGALTNVRDLTADDPRTTEGIGHHVVTSARWVLLLRVSSIATLWIVSVVLAHVLKKTEYGLAGMANIAVSLLLLFQDSGLSSALIRRREALREAIDSAVLYAILSGVALAAVCLAIAPVVGAFFHQHQVTSLVRGLSLLLLFRAASVVPQALLQKELRFRAYSLIMLSGSAIQMATAITLAFRGAGPWSPIVGAIAFEGWCAVLMWPVAGVRADPRRASWKTLRELLRYGRGPAGANVAHTITQYVDNAVIARQIGPVALGTYAIGYQLGKQPLNTVIFGTNQIAFPAFTKLRDDLDRFRAAYLRSLRFLSTAAAPLAFGVAAASGPLVDAIYGARWHSAAPVVTIISLMMFFLTYAASMGEVMKAMDHPGWVFPIAVLQLAAVTASVLLLYPHGITAVAAGVAVGQVIVGIVTLHLTERLLHIGWRQWLLTPLPAIVSGAVMAGVLIATNLALDDTRAGVRLLIDVVEAGVVYPLVLRLAAPRRFAEFVEEIRGLAGIPRPRSA